MLILLLCLLALSVIAVFTGSVVVLLRQADSLVRRGRRRPEAVAPRSLVALALVTLISAFVLYGSAWLKYSPGLFPDNTCMFHAGPKEYPVSHSGLPLSTVCPSPHGGTVDIVPGWINPVAFALVAVSVVALAGAYIVYATGSRVDRRL
ncbi:MULTISPECIES: hypothetical protein [Nocardiopsis]|uniref:Uncharacterized protein n=1 Tax=Nocardiopsis sinuspersici TaxID=501010 RepID=A0A1V3C694_9ACTN|nr:MULTISPECIES: hypothetical protein [Nocardiopsis]OOC56213.1 hypothetical protein NOSIN_22260 [Nocardiopsis sinuspersici]